MEDKNKDIKDALNEIKSTFENKLEDYNRQVEDSGKASEKTRADLKAMGDDFESLKTQLENANQNILDLQQRQDVPNFEANSKKDMAGDFLKSSAFTNFKNSGTIEAMTFQNADVLSTDFDTRESVGLLVPNRKPTILDLIQRAKTDQSSVQYYKVATASTAGVQDGDGGALTESALAYSDVTEAVKTISSYKKISEQALEDVSMLKSFIEADLKDGLRLELEKQIIQGDGANGDLSGWDNSNSTEVTVTSIDIGNLVDVGASLASSVGAAGGEVAYFVMTYANLLTLQIQQDANNRVANAYGYVNGVPHLWGVPVIASSGCTTNTMYAVGRNACVLFDRHEFTLSMSNSDGTDFVKNLMAIKATVRGALATPYATRIAYADLTTLNDPNA